MRSINSTFYNSQAWKKCRSTYLQKYPFCEDCMKRGIYTPAKHVHHIVWLNESNISDASISLNHNNLKALCHACHNETHFGGHKRRYEVGPNGEIIIKDSPQS